MRGYTYKTKGQTIHYEGEKAVWETKDQRIECNLDELGKIEIVRVANWKDENYKIWRELIEEYHYLKQGKLYGLQIKYLIKSEYYGWIGALSFSSPAWRLEARDKWIGWNEEKRLKNLSRIVCNSRFLIIPQIRVKNLASHVLSLSMKQLKRDWWEQYGTEPVLVETFVEKGRFSGVCYQSANFQYVGETRGRGRQDKRNEYALPVKGIYLYPLSRGIRELLCEEEVFESEQAKTPADWVEEEFNQARLGDLRLKKRLFEITRDFYANPQANIPQASQSRARTKAAYRFMDNKKSKMENILSSHYESTINRVKGEEVLLAVQDTTSLNYSLHPATEDLGPIGSKREEIIGLMVHDTMAFNLEGTPLGLLDVQCWARDIEEYGRKHKRHKLPIEDKESYKWLKSFKVVSEVQKRCPKTFIVSLGDRESDIYELFALALEDAKNPKLLVRAEYNRNLADEEKHLWDYLRGKPTSGIQRIRVPRKGNQPSREAELTIQYSEVELNPPKGKASKGKIKVWAILAEEKDPPANVKPLTWMLITTIPVNTF